MIKMEEYHINSSWWLSRNIRSYSRTDNNHWFASREGSNLPSSQSIFSIGPIRRTLLSLRLYSFLRCLKVRLFGSLSRWTSSPIRGSISLCSLLWVSQFNLIMNAPRRLMPTGPALIHAWRGYRIWCRLRRFLGWCFFGSFSTHVHPPSFGKLSIFYHHFFGV